MTLLLVAAASLVFAQLLGIYALKSRKADFLFSLCMLGLFALAVVLGGFGAYGQLH